VDSSSDAGLLSRFADVGDRNYSGRSNRRKAKASRCAPKRAHAETFTVRFVTLLIS
jgi:hypothetical protein